MGRSSKCGKQCKNLVEQNMLNENVATTVVQRNILPYSVYSN